MRVPLLCLSDVVRGNPQASIFQGLGFPLPVLRTPRSWDAIGTLGNSGVRVQGYGDRGNIIIYDEGIAGLNLTVHFNGHGNTLVLGEGCNLKNGSVVTLDGSNGLALICGGPGSSKANITLRHEAPMAYYGPDCTANQFDMLAHGTLAAIGPDTLLSWGITIRTFDSHAIFDLEALEQVNRPKPVVIGPHAWVAQDVIIMPGVQVGAGAIVGADSVVTRDVAAKSLVAGTPAKVIREGVSWTREPHPTKEMMRRVAERLSA